jgi:hypothetical protein
LNTKVLEISGSLLDVELLIVEAAGYNSLQHRGGGFAKKGEWSGGACKGKIEAREANGTGGASFAIKHLRCN